MIKKLAILTTGLLAVITPVAAAPILAPVDPLAYAVANAEWGGYGGPQLESLRKIINGQVTAHQVSSSYTDPVNRVIKRVVCSDPANCVMCSVQANDVAQQLRQQISNSADAAANSQATQMAIATYAEQRANAMGQQARWNALRNENTITETVNVDGQDVVTTKTVKVENSADAEMARTSQLLKQLAQGAQMQAQQQGSMVYTYMNAATESIKSPEPGFEIFSGSGPQP